jgi:hypothetical protein
MSEQESSSPKEEIIIASSASEEAPAPEVKTEAAETSHSHPDLSEKVKGAATAADLLSEIVQMAEDDFIPWEEVTLPSQGVYYGDRLPGGLVRVKAMGIHADKILATQRLAQTGQSIDYLFKHCVQLTDGFDAKDLLSGDRIFLLYVLRGITHGNIYEFIMKCPNCETSSMQSYDLNELADTITGPDPSIGEEPFKVILPYMSEVLDRNVWVRVRLLRGKDVSQMANRQKFSKRVRAGTVGRKRPSRDIVIDQTITENLALVITGFGGDGAEGEVHDESKIKALVDRMHAKDTATIRGFLRDNAPGIDTMIEVECPECSFEYRADLPITESFFRPAGDQQPGRA